MNFSHAIVRLPGSNFNKGITTSGLGTPDYTKIMQQHNDYIRALESLAVQVQVLDPLPGYPDAYFVEDVAILLPELAVITIPGAQARRGEIDAIIPVLTEFLPLEYIHPPGLLDGGDVIITDRQAFIGLSKRTNLAGAEQLGKILKKNNLPWTPITLNSGLHLKSSVNYIAEDILLISEALSEHAAFDEFEKIVVVDSESYACNSLWINHNLIIPVGFPSVRAKLNALNMPIIELEVSEIRKMDGGLTCLSLRFNQ